MVGSEQRTAVFLDRDGTLIRDVGYLRRAEQIEILPNVPAALRLLRNHGFRLVVVTNQSAIARGWMTENDLDEIHSALIAQLTQQDAYLDAIYYCPHHPVEGTGAYRVACRCRKPNAGMIERAAAELGLNPAGSYVVGDQKTDIELAERIGATALLIRSDRSIAAAGEHRIVPVVDLWQAARWIICRGERSAAEER